MAEFLRIQDVSKITGFSLSTMRRYIRDGYGPRCHQTPTGILLFRRKDIDAWLEDLPAPQYDRPEKVTESL
jgi:predicted DNA-binding transcriptional regulator AlpA